MPCLYNNQRIFAHPLLDGTNDESGDSKFDYQQDLDTKACRMRCTCLQSQTLETTGSPVLDYRDRKLVIVIGL